MDDGSSGSRFVRLRRWVAGLPGGLDAYPDAQAKGALVRSVLADQPLDDLLGCLPPRLRAVAADPPVASDWIPETHLVALVLAIADARGMSDEDVCAWARAANRAMFESPAYRLLMHVLSPGAMVRFAGRRWENWHRGTRLDVLGAADDGVRVELVFPRGLYDALLVRTFGEAFAAALELSNAAFPHVAVEEAGPESARYLLRW